MQFEEILEMNMIIQRKCYNIINNILMLICLLITMISNTEKERTSVSGKDKYLPKYLAWEWPAIKTGKEDILKMQI